MDRGAWWAIAHGVARSWTRLKQPRMHEQIKMHHYCMVLPEFNLHINLRICFKTAVF